MEHTPGAFLAAVEKGADYIEMDLRRTKDGKYIVHHDAYTGHVSTCAGGEVNIDQVTYEFLAHHCKIKNVAIGQEKILLFSEVLDLLRPSSIGLVLDIKPEVGANSVAEVEALLLSLQGRKAFVFANNFELQDLLFQHRQTLGTKNIIYTKIFGNIGQALENPSKFANQEAIAFNLNTSTQEQVLSVKNAFPHLKLLGWTLSSFEQYQLAQSLGLDGVITSNLSLFMSLQNSP